LKTGLMENDFGVGRHTTTYSELYRLNLNGEVGGSPKDDQVSWIADTPGFNLIEFLHPEPRDVAKQFPEIDELAQQCRFSDCLHLVEAGCAVLDSLSDLLGDDDEDDEDDDDEDEEGGDEEDNEADEIADEQPVQVEADLKNDEESDQLFDQSDASIEDANAIAGEIDRPVSLTRYESYLIMVTESQAEQSLQKVTSKKVESAVKAAGGANAKTKFIPRLANKYRQASRNTMKQKVIDTTNFEEE